MVYLLGFVIQEVCLMALRYVLGLQRCIIVHDKQMVEIQVPFLFSVEKTDQNLQGLPR